MKHKIMLTIALMSLNIPTAILAAVQCSKVVIWTSLGTSLTLIADGQSKDGKSIGTLNQACLSSGACPTITQIQYLPKGSKYVACLPKPKWPVVRLVYNGTPTVVDFNQLNLTNNETISVGTKSNPPQHTNSCTQHGPLLICK